MSSNKTEKRLITLIVEHYLVRGDARLTVSDVSERAGISRQAFHRYHGHLKDYVTGKKPVSEILPKNDSDSKNLLAISQERVMELQAEIAELKKEYVSELEKIESSYITTMMNNDIAIKESDEVRATLERQALHNNLLVKEKQELELKLTALTAAAVNKEREVNGNSLKAKKIVLDTDLSQVFKNFAKTNDEEIFELEKEAVLELTLKRINKFANSKRARVILFLERYISSFEQFTERFESISEGSCIFVRAPIHSRTELNLFCKKISSNMPIEIYIPYCDSFAIIKAQRAFLFKNIPSIEIDSTEWQQIPLMKNGFESVTQFRVGQGD